MAKANTYRVLVAGLLLLVQSANALAPTVALATESPAPTIRVRLGQIFSAEVGVRESGCGNCGPRVETYLAASGNHRGEAWCGAFVCWCFRQVGLKCPAGAGRAENWFPLARIIYRRGGLTKQTPRTGDCVGYYYPNLGRIGHVGFVEKWGDDFVVTVEGNTGGTRGVDRNGDGVHRMRRLRSQISYVSNWIPER